MRGLFVGGLAGNGDAQHAADLVPGVVAHAVAHAPTQVAALIRFAGGQDLKRRTFDLGAVVWRYHLLIDQMFRQRTMSVDGPRIQRPHDLPRVDLSRLHGGQSEHDVAFFLVRAIDRRVESDGGVERIVGVLVRSAGVLLGRDELNGRVQTFGFGLGRGR